MAQPKYRILREYANGVMDQENKFYPYTIYSGTTDISGKPYIRYFIKEITIGIVNTGAVAQGTVTLKAYVDGINQNVGYGLCPQTYAASNDVTVLTKSVGILTDMGTALDFSSGGVDCWFSIVYAEIDEVSGKYVG